MQQNCGSRTHPPETHHKKTNETTTIVWPILIIFVQIQRVTLETTARFSVPVMHYYIWPQIDRAHSIANNIGARAALKMNGVFSILPYHGGTVYHGI